MASKRPKVAFSNLPLGARFRYSGYTEIWTVLSKSRKHQNDMCDGVIAEWQPDMINYGAWPGQSICSHIAGECDEMVVPID